MVIIDAKKTVIGNSNLSLIFSSSLSSLYVMKYSMAYAMHSNVKPEAVMNCMKW